MNNNFKIAVTVILILIMAGLAYFLLLKDNAPINNQPVSTEQSGPSGSNSNSLDNTFTNPLNLFTITLPGGWKAKAVENTSSRPVEETVAITNEERPNERPALVYVKVDSTNLSPKAYYKSLNPSENSAVEKEYILNGYPAFYIKFTYPKYTDHSYAINNNGKVLYLFFREIENNPNVEPKNNTKFLPGYESLVNSVKFLN